MKCASVLAAAETYKSLGAEVFEISLPLASMRCGLLHSFVRRGVVQPGALDGVKYGSAPRMRATMYCALCQVPFGGLWRGGAAPHHAGHYVLSSGYYDAYYKKRAPRRRKIREEFANAFEKCDVILTPVAPTTAYVIGSKTTNPLEMYAGDICTVSVNIAGLPGLVQPCGFDGNKMPIGMQQDRPRFGEQTLLGAGLAFEQASGLKNNRRGTVREEWTNEIFNLSSALRCTRSCPPRARFTARARPRSAHRSTRTPARSAPACRAHCPCSTSRSCTMQPKWPGHRCTINRLC